MLIQRAQELVGSETPAPTTKPKVKRNITDERKEDLRQRMVALREKSIQARQAKSKGATSSQAEVKQEPKEEVKVKEEVKSKEEFKPQVKEETKSQAKEEVKVVPEKVFPTYFLPSMKYAKKHNFF
jgi:hypothetical protein